MSASESVDIGSRVQLIVDVLARSLDRAVLLDAESLTPITHSQQRGELDDVRMYSLLQRGIRAEVKTEFFALGIGTATDALWTPASPDHGTMARFCVPIGAPGERLGYLWVLDPGRSLSEAGQDLARQAGRDLHALLDRRTAALRSEEASRQELLTRLLCAGPGEPLEHVLQELQARDMAQPDSQVSVFAFTPGPGAHGDPIESIMSVRLRLSTGEQSHHWFALAGEPTTIFAVSRPHTSVDTKHVSAALLGALEATYGYRPTIGWSGQRLPIRRTAHAVRRAQLALSLARINVSTADVTVWSDLGSWKAVALLADSYSNSDADFGDLVHPGVVGLVRQGRDDLVNTLDVYLTHGGDARRTAEALHLHRSTLYYRLEKITEATEADLSDGEHRFELMLSIRLAHAAGLYRPTQPSAHHRSATGPTAV